MKPYDYHIYGYCDAVPFIPKSNGESSYDKEEFDALKRKVDSIIGNATADMNSFKEVSNALNTIMNGKTDNGKVDTFAEVNDAIQEVENKVPDMNALTAEEIQQADL